MSIEYPIHIPGKVIDGRTIIHPFRMGLISWWDDGINRLEAFKDAPTIAEFMYAMEISKPFRTNVHETKRTAEWTSTFVQERQLNPGELLPHDYDPVTVIHRPTEVLYKADAWVIDGGERVDTFLPPEGWYVPENGQLWSPYSGLPIRTIQIPWEKKRTTEEILSELREVRSSKEGGDINQERRQQLESELDKILSLDDRHIEKPPEVVAALAEIMSYERAISIASMLKYDRGFRSARVYRANGEHPIGAFRIRLFRLGDERNDFEWFKLRPIQRNLEQLLV